MNLIRHIKLLLFLLLLLLPQQGVADDIDTQFQAGNAAYSVGDYDKAIALYEELLDQNGFASGLLYNLGNSYAQKGQIGLAVLNYERALRLDPSHPDIAGNLAKVRKESGLFSEDPTKIEQFFATLSVDGWTVAALTCLSFMVILLAIRLKYKPLPRSYIGSWVCAFLLLFVSVAGATFEFKSYNPMVVIASDTKLQISPFAGASSSGAIEQGRLLYPIKHHGDYTYVTDKTGRKGWLRTESVASICESL